MNQQTEIKESTPVLNTDGSPASPGWCRRNLYHYNKERIRRRMRIKEWDFYLITDGRCKVELNFFNISFVSALTAEYTDLLTGEYFTDAVVRPSSPDKFVLSPAADVPFSFSYRKGGRRALFETTETSHKLLFSGKASGSSPFKIFIRGDRLPGQESLTTLTPFDDPQCFFLTQKLNCIRASGKIQIGPKLITLDPEKAFMTIDWGRGVWPYKNSWIWSNGSGIVGGKRFGFEMTWGIGNDSAAPAAALFFDGKCHKIGPVELISDTGTSDSGQDKSNPLKPWHFRSKDGRLDLTLTPDRYLPRGFLFAGMAGYKSDQYYGAFNGTVILDDGTRLEIRDLLAFAERVHNAW